jgi:hypothetical protein
MAFGVAGIKYCKVPTTAAKAKRQRTVLEPLARNYRRAIALTTLLQGIINLKVTTESYKNTKKLYLGGWFEFSWVTNKAHEPH